MATLALKESVNFLLLFFIILRVKINHFFNLTRGLNFGEYYIEFNAPTDPEFPLNNGDELNFLATVNPIDDDETAEDNKFILTQYVVNSFDPNDKICLQGTSISPEEVGEFVYYKIRFENTG